MRYELYKRLTLLIMCVGLFLCANCAGTVKAGEIVDTRCTLVAVDDEHHDTTEPQDTTATTSISPKESEHTHAHEGETEEPENTDYWGMPWRIAKSSIYLLKRRSIKLAIFIMMCYIYLKRNDIRYFLKRKKA